MRSDVEKRVDEIVREIKRDRHGRYSDDPLYRLPHSKCSCELCADWRAENAYKIGSV